MKPQPTFLFSGTLALATKLLFCTGMFFILPFTGWTQKRQLVASDTVKKIAYIDQSRIRKEYKSFISALKKASTDNVAQEKLHEATLKNLDTDYLKKLRADSLSGGKNKDLLKQDLVHKREQLNNSFRVALKERFLRRNELVNQYERKIILAIEAVVTEGGFTEVKPLTKEPLESRGVNVTDQILNKLN